MDQNNINVQETQQTAATESQIREYADSAFGKGLASVILSEFPVGSIIAIFLGSSALGYANSASEMAEKAGISAGGKNIAGKILGKIGKIVGIVMTIFWAVYLPLCFLLGFLSAAL